MATPSMPTMLLTPRRLHSRPAPDPRDHVDHVGHPRDHVGHPREHVGHPRDHVGQAASEHTASQFAPTHAAVIGRFLEQVHLHAV
eukprot:CAMPEP_0181337784 /NCGR_PEP_ID=MMETSP1101-20121128/28236_1 /TAXON_ID=46948 /ORGANISM="Rhodomonas abbreviata, Strain Caron Lab Isolate" /LENGTH=84 /DNA_ID=CAMNT_0023448367 /DNA_START=117 /DNA_END=371 /DNA_ORIENTATION=-